MTLRCANAACQKRLTLPAWRAKRTARLTCSPACKAAVLRGKPTGRAGRVVRNGRPYWRVADHPLADERGYVLEAVLVAERVLQRPLRVCDHLAYIDRNPMHIAPGNLIVQAPEGSTLLRDVLARSA